MLTKDSQITETIISQNSENSSNYFSALQWLLFFSSIGLGLIFRWLWLDMRPYHHDESLHGMYGRYFFDFPEAHYYKYDPMLHGPMLYNSMRAVFSSVGSTDFAARAPVTLMGSIFLFMPWLFRRYLSSGATLALTAALALSPTMIYWSRFLREDFWVFSFLLIGLYGVLLAPRRWASFWVFISITLQWCTKANVFVTMAIILGYLVFEFLIKRIVLREGPSLLELAVKNVIDNSREFALGASIGTLIFCWFYSAGFRYPEGFGYGFYKGIEYWLDQHNKERIEGPFLFHFYQLSWYELPFILAYLTHLYFFFRNSAVVYKLSCAAVGILMIISVGVHLNGVPVNNFALWKLLKLKDVLDVAGFFVLFSHALLITTYHSLRRENGLAFFAYFFSASFFTYSYLGEKVPWLSSYAFIPGLIYLTIYFESLLKYSKVNFREFPLRSVVLFLGCLSLVLGVIFLLQDGRPIQMSVTDFSRAKFAALFAKDQPIGENCYFILGGLLLIMLWGCERLSPFLGRINLQIAIPVVVTIFSIRAAIQTNFVHAGRESEFISQVHTTYQVAEIAKRLKREVLSEEKMYRPQILVSGDATWPLTWYFRDVPEYKFSATEEEKKNFTYIIQDQKDKDQKDVPIPAGFRSRQINLRGWWVPDRNQMTLKKFLNYSLNHTPWSQTGFAYVNFLEAADIERFKVGVK